MTRIIAARRTAVVPKGGRFRALEPHELAAPVIRQCLLDADIQPEDVGELVLSNALGAGGNLARIAALASGLPERVAGLSIDRQCAGGLDALLIARALVESGQHDVVIAGGAESYSRRPLRSRTFVDGRPPEAYDQARFTPWADRDPDMSEAADALGRMIGISHAEQDAWAIRSHARRQSNRFEGIVEVEDAAGDAFTRILTEAHCRRAPVITGTITAANMAVAADAAAFVVVVSEARAKSWGQQGLRILSGCTQGGAPEQPGLAPVAAIKTALDGCGLSPKALARAEIMEAFAVQALACMRGANLPEDICNPDGGALAQGHPIGASGAILATRLFHALRPGDGPALAAIAAAGGIGTAALFQY